LTRLLNFILLQIYSGTCLQKIGILDLSLSYCKTNKGAIFLPHSVHTHTHVEFCNSRYGGKPGSVVFRSWMAKCLGHETPNCYYVLL